MIHGTALHRDPSQGPTEPPPRGSLRRARGGPARGPFPPTGPPPAGQKACHPKSAAARSPVPPPRGRGVPVMEHGREQARGGGKRETFLVTVTSGHTQARAVALVEEEEEEEEEEEDRGETSLGLGPLSSRKSASFDTLRGGHLSS
ncbi:hypothetical protein AAFF_G00106670 [Aldrovandia affinis]|uniref:Uncharacterized protein n=1 Tax=Aldrovandia affinis TaxID=143900 RepID=A0AAD7WXW7_9TELE|nr:hypothetical protein AAFF_G00106670 [Aldrovandia affinis]